ncbi:unnamed protein product, partial [Ectocarpus sp. 13 AM-2016]
DVRQLSGGEKSYATLALLLSLGAHHDCPFRVMDEFDVFMDAVSRDHAILEVLKFAKNNKDKQFIFITPQVCFVNRLGEEFSSQTCAQFLKQSRLIDMLSCCSRFKDLAPIG